MDIGNQDLGNPTVRRRDARGNAALPHTNGDKITKEMMTWVTNKDTLNESRLIFVANANTDEFQPILKVDDNGNTVDAYTVNPLDRVKFSKGDMERQFMDYNLDETQDKIIYTTVDRTRTATEEKPGSWTLYKETPIGKVVKEDRLRPSEITVDTVRTIAMSATDADTLTRQAVATYNAAHTDSSAHQHTDKHSVIVRQTKSVLPDTAAATGTIFETTDRTQGNNTEAIAGGIVRIQQYNKTATMPSNFGIANLGAEKQTLTFDQAHGLEVNNNLTQRQINGETHRAKVVTIVDAITVDVELLVALDIDDKRRDLQVSLGVGYRARSGRCKRQSDSHDGRCLHRVGSSPRRGWA